MRNIKRDTKPEVDWRTQTEPSFFAGVPARAAGLHGDARRPGDAAVRRRAGADPGAAKSNLSQNADVKTWS